MQQRIYEYKIRNVDELRRLLNVWLSIVQCTVVCTKESMQMKADMNTWCKLSVQRNKTRIPWTFTVIKRL